MNRRNFLGQVVAGTTLAAVSSPSLIARGAAGVRIKFVGMMGYITRSDRSMLVATPGDENMGHWDHVPFIMARAGSRIGRALGLTAMPGVIAEAFDMELANTDPRGFVFRRLDGADLEVSSGDGIDAVDNRATQLAQMHQILPGKRLRSNLRRWSPATVAVKGGELRNSAAHPDAGKIWSIGTYSQPLTDAAIYTANRVTLRLDSGSAVDSYTSTSGELSELWVVSAVAPRHDAPNHKRLEHGHLLFEFFADAAPMTPTCDQATGRLVPATELPRHSASASMAPMAAHTAPPYSDFCPGGTWA